jgi:hypothetical protein
MFSTVRFINSVLRPIVPHNKQVIFFNKPGNQIDIHSPTFLNKNIISISPGGFYGFYMLGVCSFIKDNYNLNNYIFSGASAGAWNSLFMTFNKDHTQLTKLILDESLYKQNNIFQIENEIKQTILSNYVSTDFDLDKLFIGVTTPGQTNIYTQFENLEDAVDCCIASSHIPFITGSLTHKYKNKLTFDGGFSSYPYLNIKPPVLHITPNIWNQNKIKDFSLFYKDFFDLKHLFQRGYNDTKLNNRTLNGLLYTTPEY